MCIRDRVVVASVYVRCVPYAHPVFLPQFLNGFHSRLVVVKETMDVFVIAQWVDCFGEAGSRVQHNVVPVSYTHLEQLESIPINITSDKSKGRKYQLIVLGFLSV